MSLEVLEPERGDDRRSDVEIERLHEMTDHTFREYVSDTPEAGIGEVVMSPMRQPNSPFVLGGVIMKRSFIRPGHMPRLSGQAFMTQEVSHGRDPSIKSHNPEVPPANYLG